MARNIARYGYGPNRSSNMRDVLVMARHRWAYARFDKLRKQRAERKTRWTNVNAVAGEPLTDGERVYHYIKQNGIRRPLTPRQQRRRMHKASKHNLPVAAGLRKVRMWLAQ